MDFSSLLAAAPEESAATRSWRAEVRAFLDAEFVPNLERWEQEGEVSGSTSREAFKVLCGFGYSLFDVGSSDGGLELDEELVEVAWAELRRAVRHEHVEIEFMLQLGRALVFEALDLGDAELFDAAARGDAAIAHAVTEYAGGSDFAVCETRAEHDADGWVINGEKNYVSCVPGHNWLRLLAQTDPHAYARGDRHHALTVFLVNVEWPGVAITPIDTPDRKAWHSLSNIRLNDVRVPERYLVGEENRGFFRIAGGFSLRGIGDSGEYSGSEYSALVDQGAAHARTVTAASGPALEDPGVRSVLVEGLMLGELMTVSGWYTAWLAGVGATGRSLRHAGGTDMDKAAAPRLEAPQLAAWAAKRRVLAKQEGHAFRRRLLEIVGSDGALANSDELKDYIAHMSRKSRGGGVETHKFQIARGYFGKEFDSRS